MSASVLIVEDEVSLREVYELILNSQGFIVRTAKNGKEALEVLKECSPDAVLLDLFMPVMSGKEFLQTVKLADYPNTKIIVYTNLSDSMTESEVLQLGAHKMILKSSMDPDGLVKLVKETTQKFV